MKIKKPPIYISYARNNNPDSEEERVVNALCKSLEASNYEVVRDRNYLQYLDSIPDFLKRIGTGGYVISIVGDKYLHSEFCMIEASYMAHAGNLNIRVFPILLSNLYDVFRIESRSKLITGLQQYWQPKERELTAVLGNLYFPQGFISMRNDASLVTQLLSYLSEFIAHLGAGLEISPQEHIDENFARLLKKIDERIDEDYQQFTDLVLDKEAGYYQRFSAEYIGRSEHVENVLAFLNDPNRHFMLLYGVGGMGKSHLISECRKTFNNPYLRHEECTSNYNLKSLFRTCKIDYPEHLETSEEKIKFFIDEFIRQDIYLILDDFYETIDVEIRSILPKLASIPNGKILLVSRAVPKELEHLGFHVEKYLIPPLEKADFDKVIQNYVALEEKNISLDFNDLRKIFEKAQGYPLGGQLIIDLLYLGEKLDDILQDLPKFEAEIDEEGKQFSGRLLNNIFTKGDEREIKLLCEFSALFGASSKELVKQLPSYNLRSFEALTNRRKFILRDEEGLFNSHAMIKDFAYEKLVDKFAIHKILGRYFENELLDSWNLDANLLDSTIQHYRRVGINELIYFGQRVDREFNIRNVKSLIQENVNDTIRNYKSLIELYPNKMAYYNELGIAYRLNNQSHLAIETFLKALEIDPKHLPLYNELGITYRENNQRHLAIETFLKAIEIDSTNIRILNELGITYRENNQRHLAIETFLKAIEIDPKQLPPHNELGITYRLNNQKQLAIKTFLKAIEIDSMALPSYNELGITYRENNQRHLAIETFLKRLELEPNEIRSLNELGITYRENEQLDEAIDVCNKSIKINSANKHVYLNLLQIYLYFRPNKIKAQEYYDKLSLPPRPSSFNNNRYNYKTSINYLNDIWDLSIDDFKIYDRYVFFATLYKAYHTILPLLFKLNEKFPDNTKVISRLGKTLSNQVIARYEEGWEYLKQAIDLFAREGNQEQYTEHILYYLYNLLNTEQKEKIEAELELYKKDIEHLPKYHHFLAAYYELLEKSEEEIIEIYETSLKASETDEERLKSTELLLEYLTGIVPEKYSVRIEKLKIDRDDLFTIINSNQNQKKPVSA